MPEMFVEVSEMSNGGDLEDISVHQRLISGLND